MIGVGDSFALFSINGVTCYGIFADDAGVCTGHGTCAANDTCVCNTGYTGSDCGLPLCYGIPFQSPLACSGHGNCLTVDTCVCFAGWEGDQCATNMTGIIYASGANTYGAVNDMVYNSDTFAYTPVYSSGSAYQLYSLIAGGNEAFFYSNGVGVFGVGANTGFPGDASGITQYFPIKTLPTTSIAAIITGSYGTQFVLDTTGKNCYTWGYNGYGQLGLGNTVTQLTPVAFSTLPNETLVQVAMGYTHTLVLTNNGTIFSYGEGTSYRLGDPSSTAAKSLPYRVWLDTVLVRKRVSQVCAGYSFSLALVDDAQLYGWGLGYNGVGNSQTPVAFNITGNKRIVKIACVGGAGTYALDSNGTLYSWTTSSSSGEAGTGTSSSSAQASTALTNFPYGTRFKNVFAGMNSGAALTTTGLLYVWGRNQAAQLGDGSGTNILSATLHNPQFPNRVVRYATFGINTLHVLYDASSSCNLTLSDDPYVCNGNGNCTGYNTCVCNSGYTGMYCDKFSCFGTSSNSSSVCSGNGRCIKLDACICFTGYSGYSCNTKLSGFTFTSGNNT
jgi:alpha-tubulin suppressor-like RCC1 family protein